VDNGRLKEIQALSTLPIGFTGGNTTAEILIDQAGTFLYVSNRGHGSIAVYEIERDGTLRVIEHAAAGGRTPRNFSIDPTGQYVFSSNQDTEHVFVLKIDPKTGRLAPTGVQVPLANPGSIAFARTSP
jgi:6-phosphogluconolactonase